MSTTAIQAQILGNLLDTKPVSWTHKSIDPNSQDPNKPDIIETKVPGVELKFPLAKNVSNENVENLAERWIA